MDIIRMNKDYEILGYTYIKSKQDVNDPATLAYIKNLHIPPAWKNVHICTNPKTKIQAYGYDSKGRKQVIYANWFSQQNKMDKYKNIMRLEPYIQQLKQTIHTTLASYTSRTALTHELQIILILHIMMLCNFRIGNDGDTKSKQKAYGITTLKWNHIKFSKDITYFEFVGKKGVINKAMCSDPYVYTILRRMKHTYKKKQDHDTTLKTASASIFAVNSSHVNKYLQTYDSQLTSKDIRTWMANELFIKYFFENTEKEATFEKRKRNALAYVASQLHNTPTVCKTSYIFPELLEI